MLERLAEQQVQQSDVAALVVCGHDDAELRHRARVSSCRLAAARPDDWAGKSAAPVRCTAPCVLLRTVAVGFGCFAALVSVPLLFKRTRTRHACAISKAHVSYLTAGLKPASPKRLSCPGESGCALHRVSARQRLSYRASRGSGLGASHPALVKRQKPTQKRSEETTSLWRGPNRRQAAPQWSTGGTTAAAMVAVAAAARTRLGST